VDLCIIGGGSAGYSAAIAAAQQGLDIVLVEKQGELGGTSTQAFVSNWASSPSGLLQTGDKLDYKKSGYSLPQIIYDQMQKNQKSELSPDSVAITSFFSPNETLPNREKSLNTAIWAMNSNKKFEDTVFEYKSKKTARSQVTFMPDALVCAINQILQVQDNEPRVLLNTLLTKVVPNKQNRSIKCIEAESGYCKFTIKATTFIDSSGDLKLCELLDKENLIQSNAGVNPLNYLSVCFEVTCSDEEVGEVLSTELTGGMTKSAQFTELPNGNYMVNPLAEFKGNYYTNPKHSYEDSYKFIKEVSKSSWAYLKQHVKGGDSASAFFADYAIKAYAPFLGIRESYRLNARCILRAKDCTTSIMLPSLGRESEFVALADHNFDIIGAKLPKEGQVNHIYGIPFDCLRPNKTSGWTNLLVACRGAGFDHEAASSCRLERVMMQLGQAAAIASALAKKQGINVHEVDARDVASTIHMDSQLKYYYKGMIKPPYITDSDGNITNSSCVQTQEIYL